SPAWLERKAKRPTKTPRDHARAAKAFAGILYYGQPFFRDVFFQPMELVDPTGVRIREAFKRLQLLGAKPSTMNTWFGKFMRVLQTGYNDPRVGRVLGPAIGRVVGVGDFLRMLHSDDEAKRAAAMTFEELAAEVVGVKEGRATFS